MKIDPRYEDYFAKAADVYAGDALDRLTEIYINACGISIGERTIAVYAAYYWISRFRDNHPDLPEDIDLRYVMELRSDDYRQNKDSIDKYDVACLDPEEILRVTSLMIEDYKDELSRIAICTGILFFLSCIADMLEE